ncbi:Hsp20/alpha crystallin family protein [Anoxybacteroides tepidamans]|uniref:Hsp20/alpha crystallin family protein n=1 Tax=Anoxybacteroides tepidamans TaxID=265948 RepID=UPI0004849ED5|nr:Hsp20/alpha crystallin family protein [Anoxybacillus tepidamans]
MDFEKLKQWMEIAQKYQSGAFWNSIFDQHSAKEWMKEMEVAEWSETSEKKAAHPFPPTDIYLTDSHVVLLVELAGFQKEEIQLSISGTQLVIRGDCKLPLTPAAAIQTERTYGKFERTIELPEPAEGKHVKARLENGLLILMYRRPYRQEETITIE